jgi:hypothetical protein
MVDDFLNDVIARASALQLVDEAISAAAASTDLWRRIQKQNEEVELEWREGERRKGERAVVGENAVVGEPMAVSRPPFGLVASQTSPLLSPKLGAIKPISDWSLSLEDPSRFGMESPECAALPAPEILAEILAIPMLYLEDAGADELAAELAAAAVAQAEAGVQACERLPPRAEEAAMSSFVAELAHSVAAEVLGTAFIKTIALLEEVAAAADEAEEKAEEAAAEEEEEAEQEAAAAEEEEEEAGEAAEEAIQGEAAVKREAAVKGEAAEEAIQGEGPSSPNAEEADALGLLEMIDASDIEAHIHAFEALETEALGEPNGEEEGEDEMVDEDGWQLVEADA